MKTIIVALAFAIAVPAGAQTVQPAGHAEHRQHSQMQHDSAEGHEGHGEGEKKDCCCCKAAEASKMACCDKEEGSGHSGESTEPSKH